MDEGKQVFPRGDSAALLVIEFPSFRDFIDAYSPIISEEGIFIRNQDVSESNAFSVGDRVAFEVRLKDDFRLIQGAGEVVWLGPSDAASGAMGTAIRFHDVDEPSRRLISRLVGNYVRDGGKLFEVGGSDAAAADTRGIAEPEPILRSEPELLSALDASNASSELTAEHLEISEADALFAGEDDAPAAPLEFESVSLEDVERRGLEAAPSRPAREDPVGLDTIAIPSGLAASLAAERESRVEAAASARDQDPMEAADGSLLAEGSEPDETWRAPDDTVAEPMDGDDGLSERVDPFESLEPPFAEDFDQASLEAAAVSLDGNLGGGGGIPDDIAQVAEELSGVHRFEPPDSEEVSGVDYAGSASVRSDRNIGGRIAALSVLFVLLGAGAFYFGDSILETLGLGGDAGGSSTEAIVRAGEAMPAVSAPAEDGDAGLDGAGLGSGSEAGTAEGPGGEDGGEAGSDSTESGQFEPVQTTVERQAEPADVGEAAAAATAPDSGKPGERGSSAPSNSAPTAQPAPARAAATGRRVERITWLEEGGETIVTIRMDAPVAKASLEVVRVRDGAPREVIKIQGVEVPYSPRDTAVGSRHVVGLRTGLHRDASGGSVLHVVADLTGPGVTVLSIESRGRDIRVTFS